MKEAESQRLNTLAKVSSLGKESGFQNPDVYFTTAFSSTWFTFCPSQANIPNAPIRPLSTRHIQKAITMNVSLILELLSELMIFTGF